MCVCQILENIPLTEITAAENEIVLSYHRARGLYFLAVVFTAALGTFNW